MDLTPKTYILKNAAIVQWTRDLFRFVLLPALQKKIVNCLHKKGTYDKVSNVEESRVRFACKTLIPRRMH